MSPRSLALEALSLRALGLSWRQVAEQTGADRDSIVKAISLYRAEEYDRNHPIVRDGDIWPATMGMIKATS